MATKWQRSRAGSIPSSNSEEDLELARSGDVELGLERRAVDADFRACDVVVLPGYSRPLIRVADYLELVERSTYGGDRVRP